MQLFWRVRRDGGSPSKASSHRIRFIPIHVSSGKGVEVIGPDCPNLARPYDLTRHVDSMRPCCSACLGKWCSGSLLESEAVYPECVRGKQYTPQAIGSNLARAVLGRAHIVSVHIIMNTTAQLGKDTVITNVRVQSITFLHIPTKTLSFISNCQWQERGM